MTKKFNAIYKISHYRPAYAGVGELVLFFAGKGETVSFSEGMKE